MSLFAKQLRKKIPHIIFIIFFLLGIFFLIKLDLSIIKANAGGDVDFYYTASNCLKEGGNPYNIEYASQIAKKLGLARADVVFNHISNSYTGAPDFAVLFYPLALLEYKNAVMLWLILNNVFLLASIFLIISAFSIKSTIQKYFIIIFLLFTSIFSYAGIENLRIGNNNIFLFFLICLTFYFLKRKNNNVWAGIPAALALITKPIGGILFIIFALRKQIKPLMSGAVFLAVSVGITLFLTRNFELYAHYLKNVSILSSNPLHGDLSFRSFLARFAGHKPFFLDLATLKIIATVVIFFFMAYGIYAIYRSRKSKTSSLDFEFSMILILTLLSLSLVQVMYYIYLLIPFVYIINLFKARKKIGIIEISFFILSYFLIFFQDLRFFLFGKIPLNSTLQLAATGTCVFGTIILLVLLSKLHKKEKTTKESKYKKAIKLVTSISVLILLFSLYAISNNSQRTTAKGKIITNVFAQPINDFYEYQNINISNGFIHPEEFNHISEVHYEFDLPDKLVSAKIKSVFSVINNNNYIRLYISQDDVNYKQVYAWKYLEGRETSGTEISTSTLDNQLPLYVKIEMYIDKNTSVANTDANLQQLEFITFTKK